MLSSEEKQKLRSAVWNNASLSRILGMTEAYLQVKQNCTTNWIVGQITKAHDLEEAKLVFTAFDSELAALNSAKFNQLRNLLGI